VESTLRLPRAVLAIVGLVLLAVLVVLATGGHLGFGAAMSTHHHVVASNHWDVTDLSGLL